MASKLFTDIKIDPRDQLKSIQWYTAQIRTLGTLNDSNIMQKNKFLTNRMLNGKLYLFFYDPKHKNTLPYYDTFPLVFPFRRTKDGFYGLNLHYIPYMLRIRLLSYLVDYLNNDNLDETTRLVFTWRTLNNSAKFNPIKACVKQYLDTQVESRFFEIPVTNWITAAMLPIERFEGATKQKVWRDSKIKIQ